MVRPELRVLATSRHPTRIAVDDLLYQPGRIVMGSPTGEPISVSADGVGWFAVRFLAGAIFRLHCVTAGRV
jgi:hypothetical protein